jgi:hypothetical protein
MGELNPEHMLLKWRSTSGHKKGSFWWKDLLKLIDTFRNIAQYMVGDGTTVMFWSDLWNGNLFQQKFPRLYSYLRNKNISVATFL